jgi:hypothetical protein
MPKTICTNYNPKFYIPGSYKTTDTLMIINTSYELSHKNYGANRGNLGNLPLK